MHHPHLRDEQVQDFSNCFQSVEARTEKIESRQCEEGGISQEDRMDFFEDLGLLRDYYTRMLDTADGRIADRSIVPFSSD